MTSPIAKIGILSIGEMGTGIAKLLIANGFSVATNCKGRRFVCFTNTPHCLRIWQRQT
jgi:hypothetical protein